VRQTLGPSVDFIYTRDGGFQVMSTEASKCTRATTIMRNLNHKPTCKDQSECLEMSLAALLTSSVEKTKQVRLQQRLTFTSLADEPATVEREIETLR